MVNVQNKPHKSAICVSMNEIVQFMKIIYHCYCFLISVEFVVKFMSSDPVPIKATAIYRISVGVKFIISQLISLLPCPVLIIITQLTFVTPH